MAHLVDQGADARTLAQRRGVSTPFGSHPDEGVVTEIGENVAGVSDDLAGLGQRDASAVDPALDVGVVAVLGRAAAGMGVAGLIQAPTQHRWSLPGQVSR